MIDLDNFKGVNDLFGHQIGDKVLQRLGGIIGSNLRKTDYGFRYGGDEFVVLLPDLNAGQAEILAQRILSAVKKQGTVAPFLFPLSVSIGIADCTAISVKDPVELLKRGDAAMYRAKQLGRDRIVTAETAIAHPLGGERRHALV
jgi:diguanylate cyclase (GGDEF)-like protein